MNRGDIVIVPFPFQDKPGEKVRPAVVVQSDAECIGPGATRPMPHLSPFPTIPIPQ